MITIKENLSADQISILKETLMNCGLDLMDDKKAVLIEKIKQIIIDTIRSPKEMGNAKLADFLSQKLQYDYTYLANMFSQREAMTIECYIIAQRIEQVKELLDYDEYTLTEIADKLHYSSVSHLSTQFKKITGLTPTSYKRLKLKQRVSLGSV